jgi:hypothetical protein
MGPLIILVNSDARALGQIEGQHSECSYLVAAVNSFSEARTLLETTTPDLLVVGGRLAAYNGFQLAIRSRFDYPDVPSFFTHPRPDGVAAANEEQLRRRVHGGAAGQPAIPSRRAIRDRRTSGGAAADPPMGPAGAVDRGARRQHPRRRRPDRGRHYYGGVRLSFSEPCDLPQAGTSGGTNSRLEPRGSVLGDTH